MIKRSFFPVVAALMSACAIHPIEQVKIENHMLYIDQKGDLRSPDKKYVVISNQAQPKDKKATEGKPSFYGYLLARKGDDSYQPITCQHLADAHAGKAPRDDPRIDPDKPATAEEKYVIGMIASYCQSRTQVNTITVFIHGGLNTLSASVNRAYDLTGQMLADQTYPIFVGWRAGPLSNLKSHLFFDRGGEYHPTTGPLTMPFILVEDVFRSVGKAPRAMWNAVTQQLTVPKSIKTRDERAYEAKRYDLVGPSVPRCDDASLGQRKTLLYICKRDADVGVRKRDTAQLLNPLKYVTAPLVEGFGTGTWTSLLRRTDLLLQRDEVYRGVDNSGTALEKLLNALERLDSKPELNLIGHSMGSIVANNIISRHPDLEYANVVYMAAAARVKDVEFAVVPLMLRNPKVEFYNLSLDPYREIIEPFWLGSAPNGSLLNWIDNYFSQISSFSDRTAGTWYNMIRAAGSVFPPEIQDRVHLTSFGLPKKGDSAYDPGPQKHGEFGDYRFWVEGFWVGRIVAKSEIRGEGATKEDVARKSNYLQ
jgi:pimeloyl-ACP methyl ester carboxylesterase